MRYRPDILVHSPDGRPQLLVEVKGLVGKNPGWAADLRHNLTADDAPSAPYFLLALSDRMYVWKDAPDVTLRRPDAELETAEVLKSYLPNRLNSPAKLRGRALELSVAAWLEELSHADKPPEGRWATDLAAIGLLDSIRGGEVWAEAAA